MSFESRILSVPKGGTGAATLTNHGVLIGRGTGAVVVTSAGTAGQVLTSNGASSDPSFQTLTTPAPVGASYVTLGTDATLTSERVLTGTANQITLTDNGAGSTIVLSTPQDIATTSSPTFAALTLTSPLTVANGGSGANTLTNHGVLIGHGTSAVSATSAGTAGQALVSNGASADPTFQNVGSVTSVSITPPAAGITQSGSPITGSGSITLALANDLAGLEGISGTGIAVRTATDTWTQRSIQGTSNQIDVANGAGAAGNPTVSIAANPIFPGNAAMTVVAGTEAQRPISPTAGMLRHNDDTNQLEAYLNGAWVSIFAGAGGAGVVSVPVLFSQIAVASTSTDIALVTIPTNTHLIAAAIESTTEGNNVATLTLSCGWFSTNDTIGPFDGLQTAPNTNTYTNGNIFLPIARSLRFYAVSTGGNLNTMTQGRWVVRLSYIQY